LLLDLLFSLSDLFFGKSDAARSVRQSGFGPSELLQKGVQRFEGGGRISAHAGQFLCGLREYQSLRRSGISSATGSLACRAAEFQEAAGKFF
jgi:hypothetical protein